MDSSDVSTLIELGKFYFINQKFDEAIKEFKKVIKLEPSNIDAYYNAGLAYEALNNVESAREYYEKTLALDATHVRAKEHIDKILGSD